MTLRFPLARALCVGGFVALLAAPMVAHAQTAPLKIGYFDVKRILEEVDEAQAAKNRLQREFEQKQKQLDVKKTEIEKLQNEMKAKQAVLSDAAREQYGMELQQKLMEANKLYMDLQQELAQKEQAALADLIGRLEPVVRKLADSEGYSFVFEKNEAGLFYAPAGHDLTAQLIRLYNQANPGKGAAPKAPAKKAPAGK